jgi:mRNA interferase RelE/StbE
MGDYKVQIAPAATREIKKLDRATQRRIIKKLEDLEDDSRPSGVEKLSQDPRFWRVKVGDYRVIYAVEDNSKLVVVVIVRHRREAYRNLDQLDAKFVAATLGPMLTSIAGSIDRT